MERYNRPVSPIVGFITDHAVGRRDLLRNPRGFMSDKPIYGSDQEIKSCMGFR